MRIRESENENFVRILRPLGAKRYKSGQERLADAGAGALLIAKRDMPGIKVGDVLVARTGYQPYKSKRINLFETDEQEWVQFIRWVWYL